MTNHDLSSKRGIRRIQVSRSAEAGVLVARPVGAEPPLLTWRAAALLGLAPAGRGSFAGAFLAQCFATGCCKPGDEYTIMSIWRRDSHGTRPKPSVIGGNMV